MPAIASARSRGSFRVRRRRRLEGSPVERSIFGARLRTRCPQYGHSVTYGLTSEEQFLQTTKRSGSLTRTRIPVRKSRLGGLDGGRGVDDLAHDLAEVVVGLVDHQLAGGARAT